MPLHRRDWLQKTTWGLGGVAATWLLARDAARADRGVLEAPHLPAKAKRAIHIYCCGGLSHIDSFDYRPELEKWHGKPLPSGEKPDVFFGQVGLLRQADWAFAQRGQSGLWVSELFPHLATQADELTVIRSMFADTSNHTPATFQANTGFRLNGFPVLGSWITHGLGSETDDLPSFVVLPDPRGLPAGGSINWSQGFLPARRQGVALQTKGPPLRDLFAERAIDPQDEADSLRLLQALNADHFAEHGESETLLARIRSYELAARMQTTVPEATDLDRESAETRSAYGLDGAETADFGRACLLARRLVERGVRFVQLFSGGAFGSPRINWDGHEDMRQNHGQEAKRVDQPLAALLADLRQRGLLEETLVLCTTEFGRTPFTQSKEGELGTGRDHSQYGFSVWMAGAGLKHGMAYGATDDFGLRAVEKPVHWNDFHATVLHLLGIDHERLTFYHNGIARRMTNVGGVVLSDILA